MSAMSRSVAMFPGQTLFTVIPSGASSRDRVLAMPTTPRRAVLDRISRSMGCLTAMEVMLMMRPPLERRR